MRMDTTDKKTNSFEYALTAPVRPIHWATLLFYTSLYLALLITLASISSNTKVNYIFLSNEKMIYKSILCGIISQLQVLISILILLNPVRYSTYIAMTLNLIMISSASISLITTKNTNVIPGIITPFYCIIVLCIISRFSKSLRKQINTVANYNRIMKENDEKLHKLAYYDSLTGLPNRKMVKERMKDMAKAADTYKTSFIQILLDLDDFKKINDTAGHGVGDIILAQMAERFISIVEAGDYLGRVGGDEFSILINRKIRKDELDEYLERIQFVISKPFHIGLKDYRVTASFGVTEYPIDGANPVELLKNADIALYQAKKLGKNIITYFHDDMQKEILNKIKLEEGLHSSIDNNEIFMVFQPLYNCKTGQLRGFEALARWRYPEMGLVSPAQFIPIAEETGIIVDMGKWIIKNVLTKFMELQRTYGIQTIISINISVVQMREPSFVPMIKEILEETGFDSRYLELEITESVLITYPDQIVEEINRLRELGIRIALDDFGTGYASLSNLQLLPINILKIDKSFIDRINERNGMKQIVGNIILLAHQLGLEVVAEGVENEVQRDYLIAQNCDYIQGYLLSRPIEEQYIIDCYHSQGRI